MRRRVSVWFVVWSVVVIATAVGVVGCAGLVWKIRNTGHHNGGHPHATAYADQMSVRKDFVRIDNSDQGDGPCNCDLLHWYVGPVGSDPSLVFAGPGLTLAQSDVGDGTWGGLVVGWGSAAQSGRCYVIIDRLRQSADLFEYPRLWHMTDKQVSDWKHGRIELLQVAIACDGDE